MDEILNLIESVSEGFPSYFSNYRGITLLCRLGKLFTRILNNRLNKWAEMYNVHIEAQAGFRKHMGTVDNIFALNGLITHCMKISIYTVVLWISLKHSII